MQTTASPPIILMAVNRDRELARALEDRGFVVITVPTGQMTVALAGGARPDVLLLDQQLPDMSGLETFAAVRRDAKITTNVPVLVLTSNGHSMEASAEAAEDGAPVMVQRDVPLDELAQRLEVFAYESRLAAGRDTSMPEETGSPAFTAPALGWRARELGALMVRMHAALSCLVFSLDASLRDQETVSGLANAARTSDVLGPLGPADIGVIAPVTGHAGAVSFARRMSAVIRRRTERAPGPPRPELRVGYAAVDNLKYSPVDPLVLLARAAAAVNDGIPEAKWPWIRSAPNGADQGAYSTDWT